MSRAPFVFIGSLTAWTSIVWPRWIRSWILRAPRRPSSSGPTISSTYRKPFFSRPISTNAASMPGQDVVDGAEVDVAGDRAAARGARGRPRRRRRPRSRRRASRRGRRRRAARASPSGAAPAAGRCGAACGARRARLALGRASRRSGLLGGLLGRLGGGSASVAGDCAGRPRFLRPRPPRLPRRRFFALCDCPSAAGASRRGSRGCAWFRFDGRNGGLDRRLFPLRLRAAKPGKWQKKSP